MPGLPQGETRHRTGAKKFAPPEVIDLNGIALLLQRLLDLGQDILTGLYDNAIITNLKAFALLGDPIAPISLVPGNAQAIYKNGTQDPVALHIRLQSVNTGETAVIFLQKGNGDSTTQATALQVMSSAVPELDVIVPAGIEVWVNGTAANSTLSAAATVTGFAMQMAAGAGKAVVHGYRGGVVR